MVFKSPVAVGPDKANQGEMNQAEDLLLILLNLYLPINSLNKY